MRRVVISSNLVMLLARLQVARLGSARVGAKLLDCASPLALSYRAAHSKAPEDGRSPKASPPRPRSRDRQLATFNLQLPTVLAALLLTICLSTQGALYNFTGPFNNNGAGNPPGLIPDNSIIGLTDSHTLSGLAPVIADVKVTLNLSGGFNGDLYCYLRLNDSPLVVLLDRVGVTGSNPDGYSDTGFLVTLTADTSAHDIHYYQNFSHSYNGDGQVTGTWQADGRTDPLSNTRGSLNDFNGLNPNGAWTIFFADRSPGDESTLLGWSLQITDVPEPVTEALLLFAAAAAIGAWVSWRGRPSQRKSGG